MMQGAYDVKLSISQPNYKLLTPDVLQVVQKNWKVNCTLFRVEHAYIKEYMELWYAEI